MAVYRSEPFAQYTARFGEEERCYYSRLEVEELQDTRFVVLHHEYSYADNGDGFHKVPKRILERSFGDYSTQGEALHAAQVLQCEIEGKTGEGPLINIFLPANT